VTQTAGKEDKRVYDTKVGAGKLTPQAMITGTIKMDEVEDKGFGALINEKDRHVKILIDVGASVS
jgi:hypothetical protein